MEIGHFRIPGEATRRDYAVYVIVSRPRHGGEIKLYVGKTGDNRDGCNPIISRAGNHLSFNKLHSQIRNHLPGDVFDYDFDFFYTTFGRYVEPEIDRAGIDLVNEMERRLDQYVFAEFREMLINQYRGVGNVKAELQRRRNGLLTVERADQLSRLILAVREFIARCGDREV